MGTGRRSGLSEEPGRRRWGHVPCTLLKIMAAGSRTVGGRGGLCSHSCRLLFHPCQCPPPPIGVCVTSFPPQEHQTFCDSGVMYGVRSEGDDVTSLGSGGPT